MLIKLKIQTAANRLQTEIKLTNIGRISKSDIQRSIGNKITRSTILISDKHDNIHAFAKENKFEHHNFKAKEHETKEGKGGSIANNITKRIDTLHNRIFVGASTKYLHFYVNWFKFKENNKEKTKDENHEDDILSKKYTRDLFPI